MVSQKGPLCQEMQIQRRSSRHHRGTHGQFGGRGLSFPGRNGEWNELLQLNGEKTVFKLDTGAAVTAIPSSAFSPKRHGALQPTRKVLYGPGNHRLEVRGCFKGQLSIENRETEQDIYVIDKLSKPLLGLPAIEALTLIQRLHTVKAEQDDIIAQYPKVFKG